MEDTPVSDYSPEQTSSPQLSRAKKFFSTGFRLLFILLIIAAVFYGIRHSRRWHKESDGLLTYLPPVIAYRAIESFWHGYPSEADMQAANYFRDYMQIRVDSSSKEAYLMSESQRLSAQFSSDNSPDRRIKYADRLEELTTPLAPFFARLKALVPPERLRQFQQVSIECYEGLPQSIRKLADAMRRDNKPDGLDAWGETNRLVRDCPDKLQEALKRAGFNSPDEVETFVNKIPR
jgi:hypothetical protein